MSFQERAGAWKLTAALGIALAMAACAKTPSPNAGYGNGNIIPGSAQDFATNVGDRVFFDTDSTTLTPTSQATLDKQAAWLQRYSQVSFVEEGYADERGTREYNFALGARRAETVKDYLVARGISGSRIRTISFGKERPVAVCNDISCWSQNRRSVTNVGAGQS